ncbi:hypothetical protein BTUL_0087g00340 [Botrytis tulipae]|uniref:Uncharacterized protein n=1 Tax=Botrytis tulipae TaxID=87230 RepID=A0A4Z1ETN0_9HELO|nr:hypothetical protein BTUL_0087g00340 [Botrytis tulipae]
MPRSSPEPGCITTNRIAVLEPRDLYFNFALGCDVSMVDLKFEVMSVQPLRLTTAAQNHKRHNTLLADKRRKTAIIMIAGMMDHIQIHKLRNISFKVLFEGMSALQNYHARSLTHYEYSRVAEQDKFGSRGERGLRRRGQQESDDKWGEGKER